MKTIFIVLILISVMIYKSNQNLKVISPKELRDSLDRLTKLSTGEVESKTGVFSEIPFGKSIHGYLVMVYTGGLAQNDWCTQGDFIPSEYKDDVQINNIVLANDSKCSLSVKAKNIQNSGGAAMIIVSSKNNFSEELNIDDHDGRTITIPSKIINKDSGQIISHFLSTREDSKVLISMSFTEMDFDNKINFMLFFRSDQIKALHFFNEFKYYKELLGNKLIFTPVYKYTKCEFCPSEDSLSEKYENTCLKNGNFCGSINVDLEILDSRKILLENLRQKCIYEEYDINTYWEYMQKFSDLCANLNMPSFTSKCSSEVMGLVYTNNIESSKIEKCMLNAIKNDKDKDKTTLLEDDYSTYEKLSIQRFPQIVINGVKFKDQWSGINVFKYICESILTNDEACQPQSNSSTESSSDDVPVALIVFITILLFVFMIIVAYCYRRLVNKTIDETIEERICKKTHDSVSNYSKMDRSILA